MGLVCPTSGTVCLAETSVASPAIHAVRRQVGFMPDETRLYEHLTGREFLTFVASIYRGESGLRAKIQNELEALALSEAADSLIGSYSLGMRRKVSFLAATLHDPRILVLDEPTGSLDASGAREIGLRIETFRNRGAAVLLATHRMDLVERIADRVAILTCGRLHFDGTLAELRDRYARRRGEALEDIFLRLTEEDHLSVEGPDGLAQCSHHHGHG
jgi:ABC-2 type transport system ATP-binding protein